MSKKIHSAIFYFVINLILPGLAQLALGFYLRGIVQLIGSLILCTMACVKLIIPLAHNIAIMLEQGNADLESPDLKSIIIYFSGFILLWCWSLVEIPSLLKIKHKSQPQQEQETQK